MSETDKANGNDQQVWDSAKYEAALAHLEKLQEQVRTMTRYMPISIIKHVSQLDALRSAIPTVIAPLMQTNATKPQLFAAVKSAATTSTNELKDFRDNWTSEQTQALLATSTESKQKDGDLSKASTVPRYGWSERT